MTALRTPIGRRALSAVALVALLGAAACGSSNDDTGDADVASLGDGSSGEAPDATDVGTSAPEDFQDALLAYTDCMRDHGIEMPDPQVVDGGGLAMTLQEDPNLDEGELGDAQTACEPLMANVHSSFALDPEEQAEMQAGMLEFAECMRAQGVDMPDPEFGGDGEVRREAARPGTAGSEIDEDFAAAADQCGRGGATAGASRSSGGVGDSSSSPAAGESGGS